MHRSHWKSDPELLLVGHGFAKMILTLLGVYAYEWFLSLDFEWEFVTGRRQFRWPMIFYFANRYCLLGAMIGIIIALNTRKEINCHGLYIFIQLTTAASIGLASINLSIRTIAIWSSNKYIVGGLILAILGQWSLILQGGQLKATWLNEAGLGCVVSKETNRTILSAIFIYAMCFDFVVLLLTSYRLFVLNSVSFLKRSGRNRLTHVIFVDGLIFFIVAFLADLISSVFIILDLNPTMTLMFNLPAAVFSTIVACRAVRRLKNSGKNLDANAIPYRTNRFNKCENCKNDEQLGVHIQTETRVHRDITYQPAISDKPYSISQSDIDIEKVIEEAQGRSREIFSP